MPHPPIPIAPIALPGQQHHGDSVFPHAFRCGSSALRLADARDWIDTKRRELLALATLHGAVLFRGFSLPRAEAFDEIVAAFALENFPYSESLSNAVRLNRTDRVFSANEAPPDVRIYLHHEMAQTPLYPRWILFYCEIAADAGGTSPICRSDALYERLAVECPAFLRRCEERGLRYSNVMPGANDERSGMGRSWSDTLGVTTRDAAETRLGALGYDWEWQAGDCLRATTPPLPAVKQLADGRKTFFNQLIAACHGWKDERNDPGSAVRHGDDSPLDATAAQRASELADELAFDLPWQAGDFVLVDNRVVMHGRAPFRGERRVFASLAEMETHTFAPHC